MVTQSAPFKWRQTEPVLILCAVRWYLRYSLSLRDVEELLQERGLKADHTTVWRWVQRYAPELEQRPGYLRSQCQPALVPVLSAIHSCNTSHVFRNGEAFPSNAPSGSSATRKLSQIAR